MYDVKSRRQHAIVEVIRGGPVASQEELAERLSERGFAATQATISRDLEQLGAVKIRRDGQLSYAIPEAPEGEAAEPRLRSVFRDWVRSVVPAGNLLVIRTPPGSAHLVGVALDESEVPEIVGTICGDDTVFVAARSAADAQALGKRLSGFALILWAAPFGNESAAPPLTCTKRAAPNHPKEARAGTARGRRADPFLTRKPSTPTAAPGALDRSHGPVGLRVRRRGSRGRGAVVRTR
jgi:transcriptional regulator of arginine metabolism